MVKLYTSKTLLKMAGGRMHTSHTNPLNPSLAVSYRNHQKSLAYFNHLVPLVLFFFSKKHRQQGGLGTMPAVPLGQTSIWLLWLLVNVVMLAAGKLEFIKQSLSDFY